MKKLLLVILSVFSVAVFAQPENMKFTCGGVEKIGEGDYQAINFAVVYSDWTGPEEGYAYQAVEMERGETIDVIQLAGLRKSAEDNPSCVSFSEVTREQNGKGYEYYKFEYSYSCGNDEAVKFSTLGFCDKN